MPVLTNHFSQTRDDLAEGSERLIDVSSLLQSGALGSCGVSALTPSQINQGDLCW